MGIWSPCFLPLQVVPGTSRAERSQRCDCLDSLTATSRLVLLYRQHFSKCRKSRHLSKLRSNTSTTPYGPTDLPLASRWGQAICLNVVSLECRLLSPSRV